RLNQRVKTPCWHISLSAVPGEKLSDAQWSQVAERYLDNMKFDRNQHQYVVVRHNDTRHQHVHIVANRVAMDGSANYVKWHLKDTKKATRRLEQELSYLQPTCLDQNKAKLEQDYQQPAVEPSQRREAIKGQYQRHRRETAQEKTPQPIIQQRLQEVAGRVLGQSQNLEDFIARLSAEGIEAKIRIRRERQVGISYRLDGVALRGAKVGEDYSWKNLQQYFEQRQSAPQVKISDLNDVAEQPTQKQLDRRVNVADPVKEDAPVKPAPAPEIEVIAEVPQQVEAPSKDLGDQPPQVVDVEEQRLLAIAQGWSDAELLDIEQRVRSYFKQALPEPNWDRGRQLRAEMERLAEQCEQFRAIAARQREVVERLGVARSWKNPFGSPPAEGRAAEMKLEQARERLTQAKYEYEQAQDAFSLWQAPAQRYHQWRYSEYGEQLHEQQKILGLVPVQNRLAGIHQAQQRQKMVEKLREWRVIAVRLGHSEAYIKAIEQTTAAYIKGRPLSEKAITALNRDFEFYQKEEKQQRQVKPQPEQRGFSL
ncbi:MAG: relaxase/mobilization nuclease domain-containing protein, partial [Thermosynechococcaceae cyanobacterium MS004]|nr:relaxase/mobilization nuclease domain-containing protein [Thermosynechococcaceae cyanobacterium MS004]